MSRREHHVGGAECERSEHRREGRRREHQGGRLVRGDVRQLHSPVPVDTAEARVGAVLPLADHDLPEGASVRGEDGAAETVAALATAACFLRFRPRR